MSTSNKLSFDALEKADRHLKNNVPKIIGQRAERFFQLSFTKEGFTDKGFDKWSKRKKETRLSRGKKILSATGDLKNSIRVTKVSKNKVIVSSLGVSYADFHNSGQGQKKRQFIGNSEVLERGLQKRIETEIRKFIK